MKCSKTIFFSLAAALCAASSLNAVAGLPLFNNPKTQPDISNYSADNSQYDQTQYNPYMQDEDNQLNDADIYYGGYGGYGGGLGAAAAVGAELNEARHLDNHDHGRHRDDRAATEASARLNRSNAEREGMSSHNNARLNQEEHHGSGGFGEAHHGAEGSHEHRSMGGGHMGGHGGRR